MSERDDDDDNDDDDDDDAEERKEGKKEGRKVDKDISDLPRSAVSFFSACGLKRECIAAFSRSAK